MVERGGAQRQSGCERQRVAGAKILVLDGCLEDVGRNRENRLAHDAVDRIARVRRGQKIAAPYPEAVAFSVEGRKERQPDNVIDMRVTEEYVGVERLAACEQFIAQFPDAGAAVKDDQPVAAAHFDARGVAAIANGLRPGAGDGAAHAPEGNGKSFGHAWLFPAGACMKLRRSLGLKRIDAVPVVRRRGFLEGLNARQV
jgi:hypothetical protein